MDSEQQKQMAEKAEQLRQARLLVRYSLGLGVPILEPVQGFRLQTDNTEDRAQPTGVENSAQEAQKRIQQKLTEVRSQIQNRPRLLQGLGGFFQPKKRELSSEELEALKRQKQLEEERRLKELAEKEREEQEQRIQENFVVEL